MNIIPPHLLHKGSEDDVLVSNPRRALPLFMYQSDLEILIDNFPSSIMTQCYSSSAKRRKFNILADAQKKCRIGCNLVDNCVDGDEWDSLRALPYQIAEPVIISQKQKIGHRDLSVGYELKKTFDLLPSLHRASSLKFINLADHYFFYRKMHEHVPGTMFIEAARQAVYYHIYDSTEYERGEITVNLDELNAKYFAYAELMYPIELVVDDLGHLDKLKPGKLFYRVSFYQRGVIFAIVDTKASVIGMKFFNKIRNIFLFADDWYSPLNDSNVSCEVSCSEGTKSRVSLVGISKTGCITSSPEIGDQKVRSLRVSYDGGLSFSVVVQQDKKNEDNISWRFVDVCNDDLYAIGDIVKRGFVQMEEPVFEELEG